MFQEKTFGEKRNREEFWRGDECARRWLIYRLGIGEGLFIDEFRRLWSFSLERRHVDSWSRGFFCRLDCCEPDAREWRRGMQPLPSRVQCGMRGVQTNFLASVVKPLEKRADDHVASGDGKRVPIFASAVGSVTPTSAPICANEKP